MILWRSNYSFQRENMKNQGGLFPSLGLWRSFLAPNRMSSCVPGDRKQLPELCSHTCSSSLSSTWKKDPNPLVSYSTSSRSKSQLTFSSLCVFSMCIFSSDQIPSQTCYFLYVSPPSHFWTSACSGNSMVTEWVQNAAKQARGLVVLCGPGQPISPLWFSHGAPVTWGR